VISCLRSAGVEVVERHVPIWEGRRDKWRAGAATAARLALAEARLLRRPAHAFDAVLVGYPGYLDVGPARRAARGKPVLLNPLVTLTDTLVEDRRRFDEGSLPARALRAIDRRALRAVDLVTADTAENARYLRALADLPDDRLAVCFVGAEERLFRPGWSPLQPFTALFYGKLIPLHGVDTVLEAAGLEPDLRFRVIGSGQLEPLLDRRPPNVDWVPWVEYHDLPSELRRAGCAFGIFGTTAKAQRVIPNKAFQALACGTPLITADTPAARELLVDGESALLVPAGDAAGLAAAVRRLTDEPQLAQRLSTGGRSAYEREASEAVLGRRWRGLIERLVR
jgi:glycosyltransferase involved in cell wall biosynthesis